jgi:hypothetical protein
MALRGDQIRSTLLKVVAANAAMASGSTVPASLQQVSILREATQELGGKLTFDEQEALLTAWYDLFRTGHLSWGKNLNNPDPPFCHLTEQGRRTLAHLSRDPSNPDGYRAHLAKRASLNPIAASYVEEALDTYNANCFRAAAVMIGAAAESTVLSLRDELLAAMSRVGRTPPKDLNDWRIKRLLGALQKELELQKPQMPATLFEALQAYWPAFTQQIRAVRNDAGHPAGIDVVTPESVHAALLIFPELAGLAKELSAWLANDYA